MIAYSTRVHSHQQVPDASITPKASLRFDTHGNSFISNGTLRLPCSTALQCVLCGAYVGFIKCMHQIVLVGGLTVMVVFCAMTL